LFSFFLPCQAKGNNSKEEGAIKDSKSEKDISVNMDSKNPDTQQNEGATGKGKKKGKQAKKKSKSSEKQVTVETKTQKLKLNLLSFICTGKSCIFIRIRHSTCTNN
jgi:uncharacterized protein (DUF2344 family)